MVCEVGDFVVLVWVFIVCGCSSGYNVEVVVFYFVEVIDLVCVIDDKWMLC